MEDEQGLRTYKAEGLCANKQRLKKLVCAPQGAGDGPHSPSLHRIIGHRGQEPAGKRGPNAVWRTHRVAPLAGLRLNWLLMAFASRREQCNSSTPFPPPPIPQYWEIFIFQEATNVDDEKYTKRTGGRLRSHNAGGWLSEARVLTGQTDEGGAGELTPLL